MKRAVSTVMMSTTMRMCSCMMRMFCCEKNAETISPVAQN